jgi:hypothetical protein
MPYKLPWFSIKLTTFASWYFLRLTNTMILRLIKIYYFQELTSRMCLARSGTIEKLGSARSIDCGPRNEQHLEARQQRRTRRHESWIPTSSTPSPHASHLQVSNFHAVTGNSSVTASFRTHSPWPTSSTSYRRTPRMGTHHLLRGASCVLQVDPMLMAARGFPYLRRWIQEVIWVSCFCCHVPSLLGRFAASPRSSRRALRLCFMFSVLKTSVLQKPVVFFRIL